MIEQAVWGAFPGERLEALESGTGHVKNILCLNNISQSVVRAPFISRIQATRGTALDPHIARSLAYILVKPSIMSLSSLVFSLAKFTASWFYQVLAKSLTYKVLPAGHISEPRVDKK